MTTAATEASNNEPWLRQLDIAWALTTYHLDGLTTAECLWRPAAKGLHVTRREDGRWIADWPETEGYDIGPPSIAWLTWHIGFWWSMALDHAFGAAELTRADVNWPGTAEAARQWIQSLHTAWRSKVQALDPEELQSRERTRWPVQDRPFVDVVAWANVELMKNAAEIGYARFLYAVSVQTR
jgi:hypothetical protein